VYLITSAFSIVIKTPQLALVINSSKIGMASVIFYSELTISMKIARFLDNSEVIF
jgi:hypothetical protein